QAFEPTMPNARRIMRSAGLLLSLAVTCLPAPAAAEYPEKPIRLIVPQAPGSATDVLARLLASELGSALGGATIVVDNRPGGTLTNASSSNGSPGHVGGELFKYMTGTEILHVPYKGGAQAINDLIAGHVDLMFESLNSISSTARAGNVRALGVSGPARSPAFP